MVTVSNIIRHYVEGHPFIQEAMSRGILSYAAIAEELKPSIEKELRKDVTNAAIIMALRRLEENMKESFMPKVKFDKNTDVTVKSNLVEFTVIKNDRTLKLVEKLYKEIGHGKRNVLTVTQGNYEMTIICNREYEDMVNRKLHKKDSVNSIKGLSAISISLPEKAYERPGYFFEITRRLVWENISIIESVSTLRELILILNEDDVPNAFRALNSLAK